MEDINVIVNNLGMEEHITKADDMKIKPPSLNDVYRRLSDGLMQDPNVFSFGIDQINQKIVVRTECRLETDKQLKENINKHYEGDYILVKGYFVINEEKMGTVKELMQSGLPADPQRLVQADPEELYTRNSEATASNTTGEPIAYCAAAVPESPINDVTFGSPIWFKKAGEETGRCSVGCGLVGLTSTKKFIISAAHVNGARRVQISFDNFRDTMKEPLVAVCGVDADISLDVIAVELNEEDLRFQARYGGNCIQLAPVQEQQLIEHVRSNIVMQKLSNLQQCLGQLIEFPHSRRVNGEWKYRSMLLLSMNWQEGDSGTLIVYEAPACNRRQLKVVGMVIAGCQDDSGNAEILATPFYHVMQKLARATNERLDFLSADN